MDGVCWCLYDVHLFPSIHDIFGPWADHLPFISKCKMWLKYDNKVLDKHELRLDGLNMSVLDWTLDID